MDWFLYDRKLHPNAWQDFRQTSEANINDKHKLQKKEFKTYSDK